MRIARRGFDSPQLHHKKDSKIAICWLTAPVGAQRMHGYVSLAVLAVRQHLIDFRVFFCHSHTTYAMRYVKSPACQTKLYKERRLVLAHRTV